MSLLCAVALQRDLKLLFANYVKPPLNTCKVGKDTTLLIIWIMYLESTSWPRGYLVDGLILIWVISNFINGICCFSY